MDDLDLIRTALGGPPPSPATTFRARNRLTAAIEGGAGAPGGVRRRWILAGAATVGLLAVALGVPMLADGDGRPADPAPPPGPVVAAPLSAPDILLAAAARAERGSSVTARYWHVRTVSVRGPYPVGEPNRYFVLCRMVEETWITRDAADQSWSGERELGCQPATADDRKAWLAAGSPDHWDIQADTVDGGSQRWTTTPGEPRLSRFEATMRYLPEIGGFDLAALNQLPPDPAALRQVLVDRITVHSGHPAGSPLSDRELFSRISALLLNAPIAPAVRAAGFTVLAGIPGVRNLGEVRDIQGRTGLGIATERNSEGMTEIARVVVDPATDRLLAVEYDAGPTDTPGARPVKRWFGAVLTAEWTDQAPQPPAVP